MWGRPGKLPLSEFQKGNSITSLFSLQFPKLSSELFNTSEVLNWSRNCKPTAHWSSPRSFTFLLTLSGSQSYRGSLYSYVLVFLDFSVCLSFWVCVWGNNREWRVKLSDSSSSHIFLYKLQYTWDYKQIYLFIYFKAKVFISFISPWQLDPDIFQWVT